MARRAVASRDDLSSHRAYACGMNKFARLVVLTALGSVGCDDHTPSKPASTSIQSAAPQSAPKAPTSETPAKPAVSNATAQPASDGPIAVMGVKLTLPANWKRNSPANPMRLAEATVPDASGDASKACLVVVSTAGGSVEDNLVRWSGQVHDAAGKPVAPKTETKTVDGMKVTTAEMTGAFAGMGDSAAKDNWTLRGAIIETPSGLLFVKMTGPAEAMAGTAGGFAAMVEGIRKS